MDELIQKLLWVAVYVVKSTKHETSYVCGEWGNEAVESYVKRFLQKEQDDGKE